MCVIFRGVFNIVCCVFDNSVVFNDTFIRCSLVCSFAHSFTESFDQGSCTLDAGTFGRWRGSRYQPKEGQVCQLASSYRVKRVTYCTVISRRLGSSTARHCT